MNKETLIKRAHNYYDNCELIIKELCDYSNDFEEPIDFDGAVTDLDVILLSILFAQSIADEDFCENERDFIKSFENADNFFAFFNIPEAEDMTWDKAWALPLEKQKELSESLNDLLNNTANEFAFKFAVLDSLTAECYVAELAFNLAQIALLLSMVDGQTTPEELDTFQKYVQELIVGKWTYYADAFAQALEEMEVEGEASEDSEDEE